MSICSRYILHIIIPAQLTSDHPYLTCVYVYVLWHYMEIGAVRFLTTLAARSPRGYVVALHRQLHYRVTYPHRCPCVMSTTIYNTILYELPFPLRLWFSHTYIQMYNSVIYIIKFIYINIASHDAQTTKVVPI